ncbi:MAG: hypothetical protein NC310_07785 [Roseburia sp.]|nr:hypothetical protein [Anaeroplasma bactoclasticum]MCM1196949.1 hypothetical protein [Roseburia sp.]MCM1557443.1 hypothetical protein [Anaeroplasma bactoclasticum]
MSRKGRTGYLGMFAFAAMILNAVAWIIKIVLDALKVNNSVGGILTGVASILLLIVALVSAYDYANRQTKGWRILFWVLAIISLLSIFLGLGLPNFMK